MIVGDKQWREEAWKCRLHNYHVMRSLRSLQEARHVSVYEDELAYDELVALMSV